MQVSSLPIELQWKILKYIMYSPTSILIKSNTLPFDRAREIYDYIDKFGVFHTNHYYPVNRLFNPVMVKTLRRIQLSHYGNTSISLDINYQSDKMAQRLISLNKSTVYY